MIATNCDMLELYVGGEHYATKVPDTRLFGNLDYPPVIADLTVDGSGLPELRIDGYASGRLAASVCMSADTSRDRLALTADHQDIEADGTDSTRVTFLAVDTYGNHRPHVTGDVALSLAGPAVLVGDNPFSFTTYGAVGGAFVRSLPGRTGQVIVAASHPRLGRSSVQLNVVRPAPSRRFAR
jgi:beta-galactosidase